MQVVCGTMGLPTATVRLRGPDGEESIGIGMGTGPVDAAYKAIDSIVKVQVRSLEAVASSLKAELNLRPSYQVHVAGCGVVHLRSACAGLSIRWAALASQSRVAITAAGVITSCAAKFRCHCTDRSCITPLAGGPGGLRHEQCVTRH